MPPWFSGEDRGGWRTHVGKKQGLAAFPRFLVHSFPLMSGMEHPFLQWQLGHGTRKSQLNEMLCEQSLGQLGIAGHNCRGWSNGDIWLTSPEVQP